MVKMVLAEQQPISMEMGSETVLTEVAYDRFWDAAQNNGNRTDYTMGFAGVMWNKQTFRPKYDVRPKTAQLMFAMNNCGGSLWEQMSEAGVVLDFSNCTNLNQCFTASTFTELDVIDASNITTLSLTFANMVKLKKIGNLVVSKTTMFSNTFQNCKELEVLDLSGSCIGQNGFNVSASTKLKINSLRSIITHLDHVASPKTCTLGTVNLAKLLPSDIAIATERGWTLA